MWLIKLHIAISILCIITFIGFVKVCKETLKKNGWISETKKRNILKWLAFFVPIMNVILVFILFIAIGMTKEEFYKLSNDSSP